MPLVSVVMPCFNPGPMLRPALRSVIEQTHPDIEIVFVDNNSTDGSAEAAREIAAAAARPFQFARCAAQGANHARNAGYALARGAFIQWMDADDRLDPDKIALQVAALERNAGDDIAYGDWTSRRMEPNTVRIDRRIVLEQQDDQVLRTLSGVWYPPHLYLLRRAAAQRLQDEQGWWPSRSVATDFEYSALAALFGLRFRHVAGAHVDYNIWSDSQISGSTPFSRRAASFKAIFRRLQGVVESGRARVVLTRRHKMLLNQGWDLWRMPPDSVAIQKLPGRRFRLQHRATGRGIEVRPREAAIARAIMARPALTLFHHAQMLRERVPEAADDAVAIIETLERFQAAGLLERAAVIDEDGAAP
jgi:hypothetical protein